MSQGVLDRSRFEAIEAYVLGTMSADERLRFEQDLGSDVALRAELALQRENIHAVELGGMARTLKSIAAETQVEEQHAKRGWSTYLKYAAVIAVIATGGIWLLTRTSANEDLFTEYYAADPGLPVAMSATDDPAFADAMVSYKEGKYAEARTKWSALLLQEPQNDTLHYYIASTALADGDADAAIKFFLGVDASSSFHDKSRWFLFLAYVRSGRTADARAMGLEDDREYGERARSILIELDR